MTTSTITSSSGGPLSGIRILDFTQFLSGPYGTQILADMGADVIKVEAPMGDLSRVVPPHFVEGDSAYYLAINRNKRSIVIDLKTPEGVELARRLAGECDVVIENNRPGVMERLGLGHEALMAQYPRLVYCSISGFGQTGPGRDLPAYDIVVQALSGGMSLTGEPGQAAVRAGIPVGDLAAGMFGATGVLAALVERGRTGKGRYIDVAMLDCQISMLCYQAAYYLQSGVVPGPQGRGHESIPTYRAFQCSDAQALVVAANTDRMWSDLCKAVGEPELAEDPRFKGAEERLRNRQALWEILEARFASATSQEWASRLEAVSIPVAPVKALNQALSDEQVLHREMVIPLTSDAGSTVQVPGDPLKFKGTPPSTPSYPPHLGEHSREVLREVLRLDEVELRVLENQQVIRQHTPGQLSPAAAAGRV
jgi:crotonobetainyl-CoA:carnitine CoA-transferase CaiB-like acyl-CoA transferase